MFVLQDGVICEKLETKVVSDHEVKTVYGVEGVTIFKGGKRYFVAKFLHHSDDIAGGHPRCYSPFLNDATSAGEAMRMALDLLGGIRKQQAANERKSAGHICFAFGGKVEFYEQDGAVYRAYVHYAFDVNGRRSGRWECDRSHFERNREVIMGGAL